MGADVHRLAIAFHPPADFGLDEHLFKAARVGTAICARVGFSDWPLDTGYLVHLMRETPEGCEMRSRFWIGHAHVRGLPDDNPIDRGLATLFVRRRMLPKRLGLSLLIHCAEEMHHLASFLPELYSQETEATPLGHRR